MNASLPPEFSLLEHLVPEWAIEDGHERYLKRVNSSMDQIQAFYDEVFPQAEPPVCLLMEFGRFKSQLLQKLKKNEKWLPPAPGDG